MKKKMIFASMFLSVALVVGSIGSVFANEEAAVDNQPSASNEEAQPIANLEEPANANEEEQPAENVERPDSNEDAQPADNGDKPAENNDGAPTDNTENVEYKYHVEFYVVKGKPVKKQFTSDFVSDLKTNNPLEIVPPKNVYDYVYVGSFATFDGIEPITIEHLYALPEEDTTFRIGIANGQLDGKRFKAVIIDENGNMTYATENAKKSKSPNTSDPASVGLGVMGMVSSLGGFVALRRKK